jgi:hypothetical protein
VSCSFTASERTVLRRVLNELSLHSQGRTSLEAAAVGSHLHSTRHPMGIARTCWPVRPFRCSHLSRSLTSLAFGTLRGQYDDAYMSYLHELISMMPKYGITCYIDAHQDVWSRHTGGSGAPTWTLELVGFDIYNLKAAGAAHAHNVRISPLLPAWLSFASALEADRRSTEPPLSQLHLEPHDPPPKVWPSGYTKLAAATMSTVFWAGDTFARKRRVARSLHQGEWGKQGKKGEQVGLQEFLQNSMCEAFGVLADKLRDCEAVIGFEVSEGGCSALKRELTSCLYRS